MTTCPYTGGQVSSSLTPNLSRRTAQFLTDSGAQLPKAAAARGTTDLDQRTDVRGLLVERVDGNEINVWHDETWFNNLGHFLILGNLRIDPRFATLSCWKTGQATEADAQIIRHRISRLAEHRDLELRIFSGIDVADFRSALLVNQRWEHISAELLNEQATVRPAATTVIAPTRGATATTTRHPATSLPLRNGSPPIIRRADRESYESFDSETFAKWLVVFVVIAAIAFVAVSFRQDLKNIALRLFQSYP